MAGLDISEQEMGNAIVLDLIGDVTFGEGTALLRAMIRRSLGEGKKEIFLNFADVGYLDSSGVGELVSGFMAVSREGGHLRILNLSPRIYQLLTITKLLTVFDVEESEDDVFDGLEIN